ncbi:unnamed protein product [marine sediment metagenome]|uniref:Uncharacterized protein n=1 Tax=marine sediment metagenome TaxID=412755 RepID=X1KLD8_9ZZZZ
MRRIKQIYVKYSKGKFKEKELSEILKHDIWWTAKDCLDRGLIDRIITGNANEIGSCISTQKSNTDEDPVKKPKRRKTH